MQIELGVGVPAVSNIFLPQFIFLDFLKRLNCFFQKEKKILAR